LQNIRLHQRSILSKRIAAYPNLPCRLNPDQPRHHYILSERVPAYADCASAMILNRDEAG